MVELVQLRDHQALDDRAEDADDCGHNEERPPVADAQLVEQQVGNEGAHHVLGTVGEVDDVEQAEDDGQTQGQQCVERAIDQSDQQLPEQGLRRYAEDLHLLPDPSVAVRLNRRPARPLSGRAVCGYYFRLGRSRRALAHALT